MMSPRRKKLVTLGVIVVAIALFIGWIVRGNPSDLPIDATSGTDPKLVEAESERIPSVSLAETIGWKPGDAEALSHRARAFKIFAETCLGA